MGPFHIHTEFPRSITLQIKSSSAPQEARSLPPRWRQTPVKKSTTLNPNWNCLPTQWKTSLTPTPGTSSWRSVDQSTNSTDTPQSQTYSLPLFEIIKNLPSAKTLGHDNITNAALKLRNEAVTAARVFHHRHAQSTFAHIRDIGTLSAPQLHTRRPRPITFTWLKSIPQSAMEIHA